MAAQSTDVGAGEASEGASESDIDSGDDEYVPRGFRSCRKRRSLLSSERPAKRQTTHLHSGTAPYGPALAEALEQMAAAKVDRYP